MPGKLFENIQRETGPFELLETTWKLWGTLRFCHARKHLKKVKTNTNFDVQEMLWRKILVCTVILEMPKNSSENEIQIAVYPNEFCRA